MSVPAGAPEPKRALILAGGGLKVAFQAGVLQVWLDEAGLPFELADGASGGTFNLAMWCQGMTGTEIADAWRRTRPLQLIGPNLRFWRSLLTFGRFRKNILRKAWGLDWDLIRASPRQATFNTYNFTRQELRVIPPSQMDEDRLLACVSLPTWFPPMTLGGDDYIDAVYATDANLEAAIDRGATELWVIWTVSTAGRWRNGLHRQYFQIVEAAANWNFKHLSDRIEKSNAAINAGKDGEFPRPVELKVIYDDVPIDYLMVFRARSLHNAVELGVRTARDWCTANSIPLRAPAPQPPDPTRLRFIETMSGHFEFGAADPERGELEGAASGTGLSAHLTVSLDGVHRFLADPSHAAALSGTIRCDALGGKLQVESGVIQLFPAGGDPTRQTMVYDVAFRDGAGHPLKLHGEKLLSRASGWHPWRQTTTLYTRVARASGEEVGAGVIRISLPGLLRQLTTFRARGGPGPRGVLTGFGLVLRFMAFFGGALIRVYVRS